MRILPEQGVYSEVFLSASVSNKNMQAFMKLKLALKKSREVKVIVEQVIHEKLAFYKIILLQPLCKIGFIIATVHEISCDYVFDQSFHKSA